MIKKIRNIALVLFLLTLFSATSFRFGQKSARKTEGSPVDLSLAWQVKSLLEKDYLDKDKIDDKKIKYGMVAGLVESLDDPYTVFFPTCLIISGR